jgi:hypothetical protein
MNEELRSISGIQFVLLKLYLIRSPIAVAESFAGAGIKGQENDVQRVEEIRELNDLVQRQQRLNHWHDVDALQPSSSRAAARVDGKVEKLVQVRRLCRLWRGLPSQSH